MRRQIETRITQHAPGNNRQGIVIRNTRRLKTAQDSAIGQQLLDKPECR